MYGRRVDALAAAAFHEYPTSGKLFDLLKLGRRGSLVSKNRNELWAEAIRSRRNEGVSHFASLDTDVCPEAWWLDKLFGELVRLQADLVSVVAGIKDDRGVTTTAVGYAHEPFGFARRLTMKEVVQLPETFCLRDLLEAGIASEGQCLLANTGCFLCDLRRPWVTATHPPVFGADLPPEGLRTLRVYFTVLDRIRLVDGEPMVDVAGEDWNFSRMLANEGASVWATRKVYAEHAGDATWPNNKAWGRLERDEDALKPSK